MYDEKLYIPTQLRKLVINSVHRDHPGKSGMIHLTNLIWFRRIHREFIRLTQNCPHCIKIVKNLESIISKNVTSQLPPLNEPNEEIQLDFEGPIQDKNLKDSYILASELQIFKISIR